MARIRSVVLVAAISSMGIVGCAHQKAQTAAPKTDSSSATATAPATAGTPAQDQSALFRGDVLHFDFNASSLSDEGRKRLDTLATTMTQNKKMSIKIAGNCDERGTEEYNIALGQRRAQVAKKYLVDLGVDSKRIDTVSYGAMQPANSGHDEAAWQANRRDEIKVVE